VKGTIVFLFVIDPLAFV